MNVEPEPEEYKWRVGTRSVSLRNREGVLSGVINWASISDVTQDDAVLLRQLPGTPQSAATTVLDYAIQLVALDEQIAAVLSARAELLRELYDAHRGTTAW